MFRERERGQEGDEGVGQIDVCSEGGGGGLHRRWLVSGDWKDWWRLHCKQVFYMHHVSTFTSLLDLEQCSPAPMTFILKYCHIYDLPPTSVVIPLT